MDSFSDDIFYLSAARQDLEQALPPIQLGPLVDKLNYAEERVAPYHLILSNITRDVIKHTTYNCLSAIVAEIHSLKNELGNGITPWIIIDEKHPERDKITPNNRKSQILNQVSRIDSEIRFIVERLDYEWEESSWEVFNEKGETDIAPDRHLPSVAPGLPQLTSYIVQYMETLIQNGQMDIETMKQFLSLKYSMHRHEELGLIYTHFNTVLGYEVTDIGEEGTTSITMKDLKSHVLRMRNQCLELNANQIIRFHNHPFSSSRPSQDDYRAYFRTVREMQKHESLRNVKYDELVVSPYDKPHSIKQNPEKALEWITNNLG